VDEYIPEEELDIPERVKREGVARAPYTFSGMTAGAVIGAFLFGPPGALAGGIWGGIIGYARDEGITEEDVRRCVWEDY